MAIAYNEWIRRTGKPRNKASADEWKRTHGRALGLYDVEGNRVDGEPYPYDRSPYGLGNDEDKLVRGVPAGSPFESIDPSAAAGFVESMRGEPVRGGAAPAARGPLPAPPLALGAELQGVEQQLAALPGLYNPQRRTLFAEGARGLTDQGFAETAGLGVADQAGDGSISYEITRGPDGRLYRQAYMEPARAYNSRGAFGSSARMRDQRLGEQGLRNQEAGITRGLAQAQTSTFADQAGRERELRSGLGSLRGAIAEYQASVPAAPAPLAPPPLAGAPPAPPPAPGPPGVPTTARVQGAERPRVINVGEVTSPHQASSLALQYPGYTLRRRGRRAGENQFVLRRA